MGDIVLVHGAWAGSWCWELVAPKLRERGHRVETVELHRGTLAADTTAAQEVVDGTTEVVVCGHSYGGMVITGLELPAGSHLVYLCAFMPEEGESATSLNERHPADLGRLLATDERGDLLLVGDEIDALVWADAPAARASAARASLRSQGSVTLMESPPRTAWRDVPSTFVVALRDRVVHPDLQREMARRANHVVEWDTSHMPMLSRPDLVIDLLNGLAVK